MRELILKRIEDYRNLSGGFPKTDKRWDNFSSGTVKTHISEIDFTVIDDYSLLLLFERIVRRYNAQM